MVFLEKMAPRRITSANYTTSVNGMIHPDRIMPEHDFLYLLDGEWEIFEEGIRYKMQSDDLLILASGRHHYGERLCNPGNRHMYFHALPTAPEKEAERRASELPVKTEEGSGQKAWESMDKVEDQSGSGSLFPSLTLVHCQENPRVRQYFKELISAYWSQDTEREHRLTLFFNLFLCELITLQSRSDGTSSVDPIVEQVRRRIHSNPQISWSAREMAECFYICPRTLNNHFQKACGKTFSACQMEMKLEMVREFLQNQPDAKLHEAAVNFGFYDEFHLSKAFKRKYGQPPSKLRADRR